MHFLDNPKNYQQIDEQNLFDSITRFGRQFESGWTAAQVANLGFDIDKIENIIFVGMGGSNLSAYVAQSLSPFLLRLPFEIVASYRLPVYASKNTLVILSSYSGNTEETISCIQDAKMRSCKTILITSGGKMKELAEVDHLALVQLDEKFNPSRAPRAGVFLSLGATLSLLTRLNPPSQKYFNLRDTIHTIERVLDMVNIHKETVDNPAKSLAAKHKGQGVLFFSANHLVGVGNTITNYLNESAKSMCLSFSFPDLNHHLLEGFTFPTDLKDSFSLIVLSSSLYPEVIQKRITLTRDILLQQKYRVTVIKPETGDAIQQVFESLVFLIAFSYYLSIVNKVNPATNPWVDYLKNKLTK